MQGSAKYPTVFHLVSGIVKETGVRCVLIGGFALNYYKVTRQTVDVDFLIEKSGFEKILGLLEGAGYKIDYTQEVFARLRSNDFYMIDIDFMFVDKDTLDKIMADSKEISIAEQKFIVPSLEHLIALKLHAIKYNPNVREDKDFPDIIDLIRINGLNTKNAEFKKMCLKFGTEDIYNKILKRI